MPRVKVYFTVDVEIWTDGWSDIDARFPQAFKNYIYGPTRHGEYGLPMTLRLLADHGLQGVFFVEPMFSARFGLAPLQEVVGLIQAAGQDVQLHLHAEWCNEARERLLARDLPGKIQHLSHFPRAEQSELLTWARQRLAAAGAAPATAFRAGSFAFNRDTLLGLEAAGIFLDSSYNECHGGAGAGVWNAGARGIPTQPFAVGRVVELPVTVFHDRPGHLRPLHLTACSLREMVGVLDKAVTAGYEHVVIVSHNFELMDRRNFTRDEVVARRLRGLCEFLRRRADVFETCSLRGVLPDPAVAQPPVLAGGPLALGIRYFEQVERLVRRSG